MQKLLYTVFAGAALVVFSSIAGVVSAEEVKTNVVKMDTATTTLAKSGQIKPDTSCFVTPAKLPAGDIEVFLGNPAKLLTDEAAGGLPLSNKVRALAGSSRLAAEAIITIAKKATDIQKSAIGAGLARVVQACAGTPDYAAYIQKLVAELGDPTIITAFMAASSDVQVAAIPGVANNSVGGGATNDITGQKSASNNTRFNGTTVTTTTTSNFDVGDAGASATDFISGVTR